MLENEVKVLDKFLEWGNIDKRVRVAWDSIKKFLEESCQLPTTQVKTPASPTRQDGNCPECGSGVVYTNEERNKKYCCHCDYVWSGNFF